MSEQIIRGAMVWGFLTANHKFETLDTSLHEKFLDDCAKVGINALRFFINFKEDDNHAPSPLPPYLQIGTWNPAKACDVYGWPDVPIWTLREFNPQFMAWIQALAPIFAKKKIAPWICHGDRCSEEGSGPDEYRDPEFSNDLLYNYWQTPERHVVIAPDGSKGMRRQFGNGIEAIELTPYFAALDSWIYATFKAVGCPVIYGDPKNEAGYEECEHYKPEDQVAWLARRFDDMNRIGYITIASARDPIKVLAFLNTKAKRYDEHGMDGVREPDQSIIHKLHILNSDGVDGKGSGVSAWDAHDLSIEQAEALGRMAKDYAGFCIISQAASCDKNDVQDLAKVDLKMLAAACKASGWTPPPPEPPTPPKPPVPPTPPAPPKKQSCWQRFMAHRPIGKWQVGKFFKCLFGG